MEGKVVLFVFKHVSISNQDQNDKIHGNGKTIGRKNNQYYLSIMSIYRAFGSVEGWLKGLRCRLLRL
jgi:hypothetical protein